MKKLEATTYGTDATKNTIGQITELADQSGVTLFNGYDFKGNLLSLSKQLCQDYKNTIDWNVEPILEQEIFEQEFSYDAMFNETHFFKRSADKNNVK